MKASSSVVELVMLLCSQVSDKNKSAIKVNSRMNLQGSYSCFIRNFSIVEF